MGSANPPSGQAAQAYFSLMDKLLQPPTSPTPGVAPFALRALRAAREDGWRGCRAGVPFLTVGLEGSGHHMLEGMDRSLCGGVSMRVAYQEAARRRRGLDAHGPHARLDADGATASEVARSNASAPLLSSPKRHVHGCGGQRSLPFAGAWRRNASVGDVDGLSVDVLRLLPSPLKFVLLLRDPVDSVASAMSRFWHCSRWRSDTPSREMGMALSSLLRMAEVADFLGSDEASRLFGEPAAVGAGAHMPCTLVLSYEMLTRYPRLHAAPLAAFLGISPSDPRLASFLASIKVRSAASGAGGDGGDGDGGGGGGGGDTCRRDGSTTSRTSGPP